MDEGISIFFSFMPRSLSGCDLSVDKPCEELFIGAIGVTPGKMKGSGERGCGGGCSVNYLSNVTSCFSGGRKTPLQDGTQTQTHAESCTDFTENSQSFYHLQLQRCSVNNTCNHSHKIHVHTSRRTDICSEPSHRSDSTDHRGSSSVTLPQTKNIPTSMSSQLCQ